MQSRFDILFNAIGGNRFIGFLQDTQQSLQGAMFASQDLRTAFLYAGFGAWIAGATMRTFGRSVQEAVDNAVESFKEFEWSQSRVQVLLEGTAGSVEELSTEARELAKNSIYSATEISELQESLALMGFTAEQTAQALGAVLHMATVEGMNLERAGDILGGTLRAFNIDASESVAVTNALAVTGAKSAIEITDMGQSLVYAGTVAGQLNLSLYEVNAVLGLAGQRMIRGAKAGRYMAFGLQKLAIAGYDVERGLIPVLRQLHEEMEGVSEAERMRRMKELVGVRASRLYTLATGKQFDELQKFVKLQAEAVVKRKLQNKYQEDARKKLLEVNRAVQDATNRQEKLTEQFGFTEMEARGFIRLMDMGSETIKDFHDNFKNVTTALSVAESRLQTLAGSEKEAQHAFEELQKRMIEPMVPALKTFNYTLKGLYNLLGMIPAPLRTVLAFNTILIGSFLAIGGQVLYFVGAISLLLSAFVNLYGQGYSVTYILDHFKAALAGVSYESIRTNTALQATSANMGLLRQTTGWAAASMASASYTSSSLSTALGVTSASSLRAAITTRIFNISLKGVLATVSALTLGLPIVIWLLQELQRQFHIFDPILKFLGLMNEETEKLDENIKGVTEGHSPGGLKDVLKYSRKLESSVPSVVKGESSVTSAPSVTVNVNNPQVVDMESLDVFRKVVNKSVRDAVKEVEWEIA